MEHIVSIRFTDEGKVHCLVPDDITQAIGINPTRTWRKGDRVGKWPVTAKVSGWELQSGLNKDAAVASHLAALRAKVSSAEGIIRTLSRSWDATLNCVVYAEGYGHEALVPNEHLRWIADYGLQLNLDVYLIGDESKQ